MTKQPIIRAFFDEPTNTVSYLVADPATKKAAVIDPVLDFDPNDGTVDTHSVEAIYMRPTRPNIRSSGCWRPMLTPTIYPARPL